jgi:hypothetical protein
MYVRIYIQILGMQSVQYRNHTRPNQKPRTVNVECWDRGLEASSTQIPDTLIPRQLHPPHTTLPKYARYLCGVKGMRLPTCTSDHVSVGCLTYNGWLAGQKYNRYAGLPMFLVLVSQPGGVLAEAPVFSTVEEVSISAGMFS